MASKVPPFVHLHVHTEYSMLDGLNRIPVMVAKAKSTGMSAIAMTDHGVMHGVHEFWTSCQKEEIKPIIGCEIYVSPKERTLRKEVNGIKYYHLILLAKNLVGYHNLMKLVSIGQLEGFYYRPRVDKEILEKYSEGIICTSACLQSPINKHLLRGEKEEALEWLNFFKDLYKGDFYLELQRHGLVGSDEVSKNAVDQYGHEQNEYMKEQSLVNKQLKTWSKEFNVPLVATTDAHYLDEEDEFTQEVLFAIKDGKSLDDSTRRKPYKHTYVKTPEEMFVVFNDIPEVLENTQKLADTVEAYDIRYERVQPQFPDIPPKKTAQDVLREETYANVKDKYANVDQELKDRIDMELDIIHDKGYDDYFLVVADITRWARENNILVGARGSVGGSVVAYCLGIINIEPIVWECYFERFLNPERKSPPDIDLDIQDSRRDEVIAYIKSKYGDDRVCAIAAFGRLKTRSAIRDVCRVMRIDLSIADTLSKMVKVKYGKPDPILKTMNENSEFANIVNSDKQLVEMTTVVSKIEGLSRHVSTHACGYLITPEANVEYIPLQYETGSKDKVITQIEFMPLEDLNLMKFDFLGLANFTIIANALDLIEKLHGQRIDIYNIPQDDQKTFELFRKADTTSVFQFESSGMKRYLKELIPETLEDLCFMAAAYRPGPMDYIQPYIDRKHGKEKVDYLTKELEPLLKNTYGIAIYQEQVIRIAVDLAGYTMGQADILRKGIGKKIQAVIDAEKPKFIEGCLANGYSEPIAEKLWEYLLPFANYGFNKAHSATYALIGYWTAYLKAHFPLEFMCARLTADMGKPDKLIISLEEARKIGLDLHPPDINKSDAEFLPEGEMAIRYGLNGIKNVGHNVVEEIVHEQKEKGDFTSLDDLCARVGSLNARSVDALIKVGALSSFGDTAALLAVYPSIMSSSSKEAEIKRKGQLGIFSASDGSSSIKKATVLPNVQAVPVIEKLQWEKELLGIYFSSHPLQPHYEEFRELGIKPFSDQELKEGANVTAYCLISKMKQISTKKGDLMAFLDLEDMYSTVDGVLFPESYKKYKEKIKEGQVVVIKGKCNFRNGSTSIIINEILKTDELERSGSPRNNKKLAPQSVTLVISENASSNDISNLRDLLVENPGEVTVSLKLKSNGEIKTYKMKKGVDRDIIDSLISKLPLVEKVI